MAAPLRQQAVPHCSACIRRYSFAAFRDALFGAGAGAQQQVRGKKKLAKSPTIVVQLKKDVKSFGRAGAIVPITRGQMRSSWYPNNIAAYVTMPEMRELRRARVPMERDFAFGIDAKMVQREDPSRLGEAAQDQEPVISTGELRSASLFQREPLPEQISASRAVELIQFFVPQRIEFYRQPIMDAKEAEPRSTSDAERLKQPRRGAGAAADLVAARMSDLEMERAEAAKQKKAQAIYGSVSTQDVLNAVRAAMGDNDEAARVVLHESDVRFVDLPDIEGADAEKDRVKHVGEFTVEIKVRESEEVMKRAVRVIAQET